MADIRVIVYYVPRAPIATSYTLYFTRVPPSGQLPPPETNTNFIAKPWPVSIRVLPALRHNYSFDPPPTDTLGMFIVRVRQDEWRW